MQIDINLIFSALDKTCDSSWVKERDKIKEIENTWQNNTIVSPILAYLDVSLRFNKNLKIKKM